MIIKQDVEEVPSEFEEFETEEFVEEPEEDKVTPPVDITQYGLVATYAKNGMVLLWEWMPLEQARERAKETMRFM